MKFKLFCCFFAFLAAIFGMKVGARSLISASSTASGFSEEACPIAEHKSFAILVYAYNQADWCERALRSIMSQDYDHFRVIFIDDASSDQTVAKVESFIVENNQQHRIVLIRHESHLGEMASLHPVVQSLLDKEIVVPLQAKDWLSHTNVLNGLNRVYQNSNIWLTSCPSIVYPTYDIEQACSMSFYAAIFKQIHLDDLMQETARTDYLAPLVQLAGAHVQNLSDLFFFKNIAQPTKHTPQAHLSSHYRPLAHFPSGKH